MPTANFDTPDGDDIDIDSEDVVRLAAGDEEGTTLIELEDGSEVTVVATRLEVAADLGLDPLEYLGEDDAEGALEDFDKEAGPVADE